jgi:hypothetical protein
MERFVTFKEKEFNSVKSEIQRTLERIAADTRRYLKEANDVGTAGRTQSCRNLREVESLQEFLKGRL